MCVNDIACEELARQVSKTLTRSDRRAEYFHGEGLGTSMTRALLLATAVALFAFLGKALAAPVNTELFFSDTAGDHGTIVLTTDAPPGPFPSGGALVTSVSGSLFIVGFGDAPFFGPEALGVFGNDNLVFSVFPFMDSSGIAFDIDLPGFGTSPFLLTSTGLSICDFGGGCRQFLPSEEFEISSTPLPAAFLLFASGGALLGFLAWRTNRKVSLGAAAI
jgi:hypothetical protein